MTKAHCDRHLCRSVVAAGLLACVVSGQTTEIVSVNSLSEPGNDLSGWPAGRTAISADGRFVVFGTESTNLDFDDLSNGDVYLRDRRTGHTEWISVPLAGAANDGGSGGSVRSPAISGDGQCVAFGSSSTALVERDTNGEADIFVRDRTLGVTTRVSVSSSGEEGNDESYYPAMSADGRFVAFTSNASNLVDNDTNDTADVFVHELASGETVLVSVSSAGVQGNGASVQPALSGNGRFVAFRSSSDLTPIGLGGKDHVYLRDVWVGETTLVSVNESGVLANANCQNPCIADDGVWIGFDSGASNLVPDDLNFSGDVFVHNRIDGTTIRASVDSNGHEAVNGSQNCSLSADGRYAVFGSWAFALVVDDTNGGYDVFRRDTQTGQTVRLSVADDGQQVEGGSWADVSADGTVVAFQSGDNGLVPDGGAVPGQVFVRDSTQWLNLGYGLVGDAGQPMLDGGGVPSAGQLVSITLFHAPPLASVAFVAGLSTALLPLKGGVLVPTLDVVLLGLPTDLTVTLTLSDAWPSRVPSGARVYFQCWVPDRGGIEGMAASNGLRVTAH